MNSSRPTSTDPNHKTPEEVPFPFFALPTDIRCHDMYPNFLPSLRGMFGLTSHAAKNEVFFSNLFFAAVFAIPGNQESDKTRWAAITILEQDPNLLFKKLLFKRGMAADHPKIWASPYQLFLWTGNVWALKQIHEAIIPRIPNGVTQAQAQFREWFPYYDQELKEGQDKEARLYDDRNKQQVADIVNQLAIVKQLMKEYPFDNNGLLEITQAINVLCQLFRPKPDEVRRSGLLFPLAIIKEIYKLYDGLGRGSRFFSLNVIHPALDALSTVDKLCCRDGLKNFNLKSGPVSRCSPVYQHPIDQPLHLMRAIGEEKLTAELVDPYNGDVGFSTVSGRFYWFDKSGARLGTSDAHCRMRGTQALTHHVSATPFFFEELSQAKMSDLESLCGHSHSRSIRPGG